MKFNFARLPTGRLSCLEGENMEQITVTNDGGKDIQFKGELSDPAKEALTETGFENATIEVVS